VSTESDRWVQLDGCINFRDLGGYRTVEGRTVSWRRVYRADSLHRLTDTDATRIADELRVVTALDLRAHDEVEKAGRGLLEEHGVQWMHAATTDKAMHVPAEGLPHDWHDKRVSELYLMMLELGAGAYANALEVLADPDRQPAIIFCMAGKDRTGLLSAVVLSLLGVPEDDVVADYALTGNVGSALRARNRTEFPESARVTDLLPPDILRAPAYAMAETLELVHERYGSVAGYAAEAGAGPDITDRLRAALLE
jgi:protein-tyrosine phosphatase